MVYVIKSGWQYQQHSILKQLEEVIIRFQLFWWNSYNIFMNEFTLFME